MGNRGIVAVVYDNCRLIHRTFHNSSPTDYSWSLARVVTKRALIIYIKLKLFQRIFNLLKNFFLFYCYVDFPRITVSQSEGDYLIYRFNKKLKTTLPLINFYFKLRANNGTSNNCKNKPKKDLQTFTKKLI